MTLRESDGRIVPTQSECQSESDKPGNTGAGKAARISRDQDDPPPTLSGETSVLDRLDRIAHRAKTYPEEVFNNLFSLLNYELLWYAFRRLKRGKTPGVDGTTVEDYEENLEGNLRDLLDRLHRGAYQPKPSLRKNIPKGNGKTRPLGISKVRRTAKRHLSRRSQKSYVNWKHFNRFTELHPLASPQRLTDLIAMNRQRLCGGAK